MATINGTELSDVELDSVVGGGVWGWIKGKAKAAAGVVVRGVKWVIRHPEILNPPKGPGKL